MKFGFLDSLDLVDFTLPNLKNDFYVICDRFLDSTLAYQSFGRGVDLKFPEFASKENWDPIYNLVHLVAYSDDNIFLDSIHFCIIHGPFEQQHNRFFPLKASPQYPAPSTVPPPRARRAAFSHLRKAA